MFCVLDDLVCHLFLFLLFLSLSDRCRCRGLLLRLITFSTTYTHSVGLHTPHNTQHAKHNIHKRQTPIPPAGFEFAIPAGGWPQTYVLEWATSGIDISVPPSSLMLSPNIWLNWSASLLHIWQSPCWTFGSTAGVEHFCVQMSYNIFFDALLPICSLKCC